MKPASGSRFGRNRFRIVYVNRFGSHHSGTVIHYSSGHLRQEGKADLADTMPCIQNKAHSPIPNGLVSGCAILPPSHEGQKSPCFGPGATSKMHADKTGIGFSPSLTRGRQAKSPKAAKAKRIMAGPPCPPNKDWGCQAAALSPTVSSNWKGTGGYYVTQSDVFEFSAPLKNANNMVRKRKKKSAVWCGVSKVISKMIEENGHFRDRLIHCSQLSSKSRDINENAVNGASCIDTDEAIFGWV
ncbi:uncharacterized protein C5orf47 homolog isoform X2 [Sceloporus undulatus]|uniref:uncharacterized protein C5orf47 homolog isoform X2 n=1 Tax=Sceloporus undulatus TaxID=8520 RepID=UPI001C4D5E78|nr:uncharacterized protein C5orf47 homolog isoform X2 [Sceloporus undulatus]